ncbi:hypothetical protein CYY_007672 [Polysphondylium violaceum]|uniref:Uncharacterized protein n=1 Tax=Polysphondylium violaceum TaxID=133409 RepID=A0A8J4V213_9MYCE|nr:hypothetical protein CYY_007672 [Polysphondylium violaceum]
MINSNSNTTNNNSNNNNNNHNNNNNEDDEDNLLIEDYEKSSPSLKDSSISFFKSKIFSQSQKENNNDSGQASGEKTPLLTLAYLYFIVIASVLGTGILALPVKLAHSGFTPFVASYTLCYTMQLLSIFFLIEVLQRIYSIIRSNSNFSPTLDDNQDEDSLLKDKNSGKHLIQNSNQYEISMEPLNSNFGNSTSLTDENNNNNTINSESSSPRLDDTDHDEVSLNSSTTYEKATSIALHEDHDGVHGDNNDHNTSHDATPNLHIIGLKFLGPISYTIFICSVLLHFCATLISYGLAGSEAYAQLFNIDHQYIILPVVVGFASIVIFGSNVLQHIITFFTFGKGTLLATIVFITGIISHQVETDIDNNWSFIGKSFLISTVALGGAGSVLPSVFNKIIFSKKEMMKCYIVVGSALTTIYVLNITWCWFLLGIIPQLPNPNDPAMPSLEAAAESGSIATIPLMKMVKLYYPQFLWITRLIDIFIVVSITISFITVGSGFKHTLDGFSQTWRTKSLQNSFHQESLRNSSIKSSDNDDDDDYNQQSSKINENYFGLFGKVKRIIHNITYWFNFQYQRFQQLIHGCINNVNQFIDSKEGQSTMNNGTIVRFPIREFIFYGLFFGFILLIALLNPSGFLQVMEGGSSLGLNLQTGTFMVLIISFSRKNYENYSIPLPVHDIIFKLRYVVFCYFTFAVFYDFYVILF